MRRSCVTSRCRSRGLLVEKFGGPSVRPYQPEGYLLTMNFPKREYSASRGEDLYRRGVYTQWQRTFLHPELLAFDAPTREECTVNRVELEHAAAGAGAAERSDLRGGGSRLRAERSSPRAATSCEARLEWAFQRAADARRPTAEQQVLDELHQTSAAQFRRDRKAAEELLHVGEAPPAGRSDRRSSRR